VTVLDDEANRGQTVIEKFEAAAANAAFAVVLLTWPRSRPWSSAARSQTPPGPEILAPVDRPTRHLDTVSAVGADHSGPWAWTRYVR
jgi:hypothetical protein